MYRTMIVPILSILLLSCSSPKEKKPSDSTLHTNTFHFKPISKEEKEQYAEEIAPLYQKLLIQRGFNGAILMAKNGEVVFEDYHGIYDYKTKDSITPVTPFHLASISKTFTGMTILHLWEEGKLGLDDPVQKYFPEFPYQNVTIKLLLSHRSGLPNYVYFMDDKKTEVTRVRNKRGKWVRVVRVIKSSAPSFKGFATNQDVLNFMITNKPAIQALPDRGFHYCNTNYALLALIIEKITQQPFPKYMQDSVFTKLGMHNSYIFSIADTAKYIPSYQANKAPFKLEKLDCVYGDKNVYSTPRDLLLWDRALYEGTFVSKATLDMAFQPFSHENKSKHNYGLGWRMLIDENEGTIIYHNGWWHGNNTVFTRLINDTATLIILGNKYNRNIYAARQITSVFTGKSDTTRLEE
ncbi:MAG: beta-lactamase family protein [Bacteroidota bacterium]|nr:beta-lactamase family protein [Bacteroidota bacterium]